MNKLLVIGGALALAGIAIALNAKVANASGNYNGTEFAYRESLVNTTDDKAKLPMVIAFHAAGGNLTTHDILVERFKETGKKFRLITIRGPIKKNQGFYYWEYGPAFARESAKNEGLATVEWTRLAAELSEFIENLTKRYPTRGKPILTGSSQGGEVALLMGTLWKNLFNSVVVVNAYLIPSLWGSIVPTDMIHGQYDDTVPFKYSSKYAKEFPGSINFYPVEGGHAVNTEMKLMWNQFLESRIAAL